MKILVVAPYFKPAYVYGGPARSIPALCEGLASLGCDVTVYTTNASGKENFGKEVPAFQEVNCVHVHFFNRDLPGNYFYSRGLCKACYQSIEQFDLVYIASNWGYPFLPSSRVARSKSIPYVVTPRTSFMQRTWNKGLLKKTIYHWAVERSLIKHASALHYTTALEMKESAWLNLKNDYFIVPNPVQLDEFDQLPARGRFRRKYGVADNNQIILYLGRIEHRKGIDISLEAFAQVSKALPNRIFVIAGPEEDGHIAVLKEMASKLDVDKKVLFTGYLNPFERLDAFVDADLFVLTSYSENFGMAVVEAMACSLPVAVSEQVGLADLIRRENVGLVTSLDPDQISEAWITLLNDAPLRQQMGSRAKQVARQQFAPSVVAGEMLQAFNGILAQMSS